MIQLAKKLSLDPKLIKKLEALDINKVKSLADKCQSLSFNILKKQGCVMRLGVILELAIRIKERYDKEGVDEKIYYDTMGDIKIWCEENGNKGLKNYGWLKNHVCFEIFRLGRLQFMLYKCNNPRMQFDKIPFADGDNLVYIHVPRGEKLDYDKCVASIDMANEFFRKYFPDFDFEYYFCESWLLHAGNKEFMAEDSNIVKFMSLFQLCYSRDLQWQTIERVFGRKRLIKKNYPEKTSLQKSAKEYILNGNRFGIGIGVIKRS